MTGEDACGNYDEYLFYEMLRSNLDFARKVSDKEFRIVKRTIEETVVY